METIRVLPIKGGAYFCYDGLMIDFVWFLGGEGSAVERVARFLGVDVENVKAVKTKYELTG